MEERYMLLEKMLQKEKQEGILGIFFLSCNIALKSFLSSFAISATSYFKNSLFVIPMQ